MKEQERREAQRIHFESRILIKTEDDTVGATADSRNISLNGIYLLPEKKLPIGTCCTLDILLRGSTSAMTITIPGRVCRLDEEGMGIAFTELQVDNFVHIKNLMKLHQKERHSTQAPTFPCQQE